jgi:hypothetical protein
MAEGPAPGPPLTARPGGPSSLLAPGQHIEHILREVLGAVNPKVRVSNSEQTARDYSVRFQVKV